MGAWSPPLRVVLKRLSTPLAPRLSVALGGGQGQLRVVRVVVDGVLAVEGLAPRVGDHLAAGPDELEAVLVAGQAQAGQADRQEVRDLVIRQLAREVVVLLVAIIEDAVAA